MQHAATLLGLSRERGPWGRPRTRLAPLRDTPNVDRRAYARLKAQQGAMTPGTTPATVAGRSRATRRGTPPGGVASPLCAHRSRRARDRCVDQAGRPVANRGRRRRGPPPYEALRRRAPRWRRQGHVAAARSAEHTARRRPAPAPDDPTDRRGHAVRDAERPGGVGLPGPRPQSKRCGHAVVPAGASLARASSWRPNP